MELTLQSATETNTYYPFDYAGFGIDGRISAWLNSPLIRNMPGHENRLIRKYFLEIAIGLGAAAVSRPFPLYKDGSESKAVSRLFLNGTSLAGHCRFPVSIEEPRIFMNNLENFTPQKLLPWIARVVLPRWLEDNQALANVAGRLGITPETIPPPPGEYLEDGQSHSFIIGKPVQLQISGETSQGKVQPNTRVTVRRSDKSVRTLIANDLAELATACLL